MSCCSERLNQSFILLTKNFTILKRRWTSTLFQVIVPALAILLLYILSANADKTFKAIDHPPQESLSSFYSCKKGAGEGSCFIILYGPDTTETRSIMTRVAENMKVSFGSLESGGMVRYIPGNTNKDAMLDWIMDNGNRTMTAVYFDKVDENDFQYTLMYNATLNSEYIMVKQPLMVKRAVDEAVFQKYVNADVKLDVDYRAYPTLQSKQQGEAVLAMFYGAPFFYFGAAFAFISLMNSIVVEKENKLRFGMKIMGLKDSVYWFTWLLTVMVINLVASLIMIGVGYAIGLRFFTNTNFFVLLVVFITFQFSLVPMAFFFCNFINKSRSANLVGFGVLLFGMFFMMFLCNGMNVYSWYQSGEVRAIFRYSFMMFPYFNFGRCYSDIVYKSVQQNFDSSSGKFANNGGYTWGDLYKKNLVRGSVDWDIPPTVDSIYLMLFNFVFFFFFAWYLDNVLPGADGVRRPPYFMFTGSYWGFHSKSQDKTASALEMEKLRSDGVAAAGNDQEISEEIDRAFQAEDHPVRILGLKKVFRFSVFGKHPEKDVHAVQGLTMTAAKDSLFALLGHNGAGKTTTISILVGLYPPSEGEAFIYGHSVRTEIDEIRRIMGVCPQHDILWNELSAREHLRMFCRFKRIAGLDISEEVERRLQDVDLDKVGDKLVGTFSGGMKRRLSVAISAIGNPKIIFMDEPTTGMDPASRRQVWQLIRNMKEGRVILLTTHSMEEADTLSDRIGIMAFGGLRCLGTSLRLKTRFGDGYHLNLVTEPRNASKVKAMVHQLAPDSKVLSENAGNLIFNVPFGQEKKLALVFQFVEKDLQEDESDRLVKDWGISHTTLEEVYLKVTQEADFGYGSGQKNVTTGVVMPTQVRGSIYRAARQSIVIGQPIFAQPYQTGIAAGPHQPVTYQAVTMGVPIGR